MLPKDPAKRIRRHKPTLPLVLLGMPERPVDGALPVCTFNDGVWHPSAIRWWHAWFESPMAERFVATDRERLTALMPMVHAYWVNVEVGKIFDAIPLLREIRTAEIGMGGTIGDRQRLGWTMTNDKDRLNDPKIGKRGATIEARDAMRLRLTGTGA